MMDDRENMTLDQLVDILAQKTEKFTRLMIFKNFGDEYKECKKAIQQILAEIELKKAAATTGQNQQATP
jgi:predicted transposase YdaD